MKTFNLVALALAGSVMLSMLVAEIARMLMGESGIYVALPLSLFIGLNARKGAEKLLGYTLLEASKGEPDDQA
jgi:hypothetical protein